MLKEDKLNVLSVSTSTISWPTVIIGAIVIITLSILLNVFNAGLGFSLVLAKNGILSLVLGSAIWLIISGSLIMLLAGFITGVILPKTVSDIEYASIIHGFLAWSLALIVTFYFSLLAGGQLFVGSSLFLTQDAVPQGLITHKANVLKQEADQVLGDVARNQQSNLASQAQQTLRNSSTDEKVTAAAAGASFLTFVIMLTGLLATVAGTYLGYNKNKGIIM
jgi:hypothetical protein